MLFYYFKKKNRLVAAKQSFNNLFLKIVGFETTKQF